MKYIRHLKDILKTPTYHKVKTYLNRKFDKVEYHDGSWVVNILNRYLIHVTIQKENIISQISKTVKVVTKLKDIEDLKRDIIDKIIEIEEQEILKLNEELPLHELKDILSEIDDLATIKYNIKIDSNGVDNSPTPYYRMDYEPRQYYKIYFTFTSFNKEEYKEFLDIMDSIIGRIRSTYNVELKGRITKLNIDDLDDEFENDFRYMMKDQYINIFVK